MSALGKLQSIEPREQWPNEAQDFTPWLASDQGLDHLNAALGMDLEVIDTEVMVGNYRADIVAQDVTSSHKVVIENQLDPTDHDHIGKLITYAAGVSAVTIVWVARTIREEHRRAIEWLNDNTSSDIEFYAIEIELWRIGESLPAPRLSVVAEPNIQVRAIRRMETSKTQNLYFEFWDTFLQFMKEAGEPFGRRKPSYAHWYYVSIGRSGATIDLTVRKSKCDIGCELELSMPEKQQFFNMLNGEREAIESVIGSELEWLSMEDKKSSRIVNRADIDINQAENWQNAFEWYIKQIKLFKTAFEDRVKGFESVSELDEM